jgi:hypothetical protein
MLRTKRARAWRTVLKVAPGESVIK